MNFWESSTKDYILSKCEYIQWCVDMIRGFEKRRDDFKVTDYWKIRDSTSDGLREIELTIEDIRKKLNLSFWDRVGYRRYQFKHLFKKKEK